MCEYGLLHPRADGTLAAVTFVVPVRNGGEELPELIGELAGWGSVLVVDDGSRDGSSERAAAAGAEIVTNDRSPGPAGARNAGLAAAETEFVAFVDADCRCALDWARPLAALLAEDPGLALVAPRVRSGGAVARSPAYERSRSPRSTWARSPAWSVPGGESGSSPRRRWSPAVRP